MKCDTRCLQVALIKPVLRLFYLEIVTQNLGQDLIKASEVVGTFRDILSQVDLLSFSKVE